MAKKIEALLFTDLHINDLNINICNSFLNHLCNYIEKNEVPKIFFLGDFFDNRKGLSDVVLTFGIEFMEKLSQFSIPIYMIPGNHDKFIEDSYGSYLKIFPYIKDNIFLIKGFKNTLKNSEIDYYFYPYYEGNLFEESLNYYNDLQTDPNKKNILLGHYMYEQIPIEIKRKFNKILLGHNHEREDFPNGMYLGSCFQQNFSEDIDKGFSILYDDLSLKLITFHSEKEFIVQKIDINSFNEEQIKQFIINFIEENKNKNVNRVLKIEFIGYNKDLSNLKELCKQYGVYFTSKVENNAVNEKEEILNISKFSSKQIQRYFDSFCEENNITPEVKEKLTDLLKKFNN